MSAARLHSSGLTLICTGTIQNSSAIGTVATINMRRSGLFATQTEITIPNSQSWLIYDVYILAAAGAGTSDPTIQVLKNNDREMVMTPNLSSMLVSNNSRPQFGKMDIKYNPTDILSMLAITSVANDTADDNLAFRVGVAIL
jgi:hypothetical protein